MSDLKTMTPLNRAPLLHVTVQESLKQYIEDNQLKAGNALPPETFLAQQLGVGRNSMREAIKALESLGILETRRGIGVFVKEFSFKPLLDNLAYGLQDSLRDVEELREIRRVLETGLIGKTIAMIDEADIAELRALTARMKQRAERQESFAEEDQQFHQMLFRCQNNHMLSALIDIFWTAFNKASDFSNLNSLNPLDTWRDHHEIVEAVARKDVAQARQRLDDHYRGIQQVIAQSRETSSET
ncbi:MAG: FadR/GntR family transcriptional regulator [Paracoccus sp. (in: a-proteobacteria)]|nr:FadR/GntR family transcriptional regulator [Paracoccus sp. (in: a-proteobacteria)]